MLDARLIHRDFLQGMVKIFILHHASQGPVYGNKLSKALHALGYQISPGSLYPLLHHLENSGLLHSRLRVFKGRLRKYYQLTEQGRVCLAEIRQKLGDLVQTVILGPLPEPAAKIAGLKPATHLPVNG
ncbi:MAG: PadR family transcriptional regulator [Thermodesulfobacteriota bacterium]